MGSLRRHNPALEERLERFLAAGDTAGLLASLDALGATDFRTAGYLLSETLLPRLSGEAYWTVFAAVVPHNPKAYLGTFLKAAATLYGDGRLDMAHRVMRRFAATEATPVDRRKTLEALLPLLRTPAEAVTLLDLFGIPASMLPEVRPSSGDFGITAYPGMPQGIPIRGVAGDQQAALFGQCCTQAGRAKNTYGTGCFLLMHTGGTPVASSHGLVTTVAASAPGVQGLEYALEGSVFVAGALIQWLRDELGIISDAAESETLARSVEDTAGVYVVPAFTGLGAPYWDSEARGAILGLTRGANKAHIARASLESMAFQVADVAHTMEKDSGIAITELNVDGGASDNDFLLQFQSDILGASLNRPKVIESTGAGAAFLAGLSTGFWEDMAQIRALREHDDHFTPKMDAAARDALMAGWHDAVRRVMTK